MLRRYRQANRLVAHADEILKLLTTANALSAACDAGFMKADTRTECVPLLRGATTSIAEHNIMKMIDHHVQSINVEAGKIV